VKLRHVPPHGVFLEFLTVADPREVNLLHSTPSAEVPTTR
jgi:hypothetical protein